MPTVQGAKLRGQSRYTRGPLRCCCDSCCQLDPTRLALRVIEGKAMKRKITTS